MRITIDFAARMTRRGLVDVGAVMNCVEGRCLRALRNRENWYLPPVDPASGESGLYLKKHHARNWWTRLRAAWKLGAGRTAGRVEAERCRELQAAGVPNMRVVAHGERLSNDGWLESFFITEELVGYDELDLFMGRRFPAPHGSGSRCRDRQRDALIRQAADLVGRFHRAGYNHRDMYIWHLFARESAPGRVDLRMIDLQRVQHRRRLRGRWLVKDLGQMAYSATSEQFSATDRLRFMLRYLGVRKLRASDKRLIRRILSRQQVMERRLGRQRPRQQPSQPRPTTMHRPIPQPPQPMVRPNSNP